MQDPTTSIRTYHKQKQHVCHNDFFFSAGFNGIKGAVKHQPVTKKLDIGSIHSAEVHCYFQYSQLYCAAFVITN
jgi:hypothetical protein